MSESSVVIIGASGLIGNNLLKQILSDEYFTTIRILVRKKLAIDHPKLQQEMVDFDNINDFTNKFGMGEIIFCCVGTTTKKVKGDMQAYAKIDVDIPVNAARIGMANNFQKYLVVSSAGANENSGNFYLRLKGNLEKELKEFSFHNISIFRPGQLLGKRNEYRKGEQFFQKGTKLLSFFLFGSLKKYHSIKAEDVATAMITESKRTEQGIRILHYEEMMKLIK